ncbi:unnamed protein product, partial [Didymodactylos carnosus]
MDIALQRSLLKISMGLSVGGVAKKLRELFFTFGPPKLLHSDNGAEFVADVITALKLLFPDMCFI